MLSMSSLLLVALFIGTTVLALLAFQSGLVFGRWRSQQPDPEPQLPARTLVASILSLLSFMLGFTFGLAFSHYDSRNQSVFDETIAIGTAYHRADLLPEPERTDLRLLLRRYVDVRLEAGQSPDKATLAQLRLLQDQIWREAVDLGRKDGRPSAEPLMRSITEVIDVHGERVLAGFRSRIPMKVWITLYSMMVVSLAAAGYSSGLAGARKSVLSLAYAILFSAVIIVIAAGDVPGPDQLRLTHSSLADLRTRMTGP